MRIYVTQHLVILNIIVTDNIFYPFCYSAAAESGDQQSSEQEENRGEGRGIPSFGMCGAICETCGHDYVVSWKHSDQRGRNVDYTDFHRGWWVNSWWFIPFFNFVSWNYFGIIIFKEYFAKGFDEKYIRVNQQISTTRKK